MQEYNIYIIGAGSLGTLFGYYLSIDGNKVRAFISNRIINEFKKAEKRLINPKNKEIFVPKDNFEIINNRENIKKNSIIIISTKAYSLLEVIKQYDRILQKAKLICLLQNGLGNEELIYKSIKNVPIFRIITSNGALMEKVGIVHHTGYGDTFLCQMIPSINENSLKDEESVKWLIKKLNNSGIKTTFSDNPEEIIWRKAVINIGINAFGALTHLRNGDLLKINSMIKIITDTVNEAIHIAMLKKIPLKPEINYLEMVLNVINNTKKNKNSMLQDILKKKKTEIDFLNGKIVEMGHNLQISTPLNQLLTVLIHGLEMSFNQ